MLVSPEMRSTEIRSVFRLAKQLHDHAGDPAGCAEQMSAELARLIDAQVVGMGWVSNDLGLSGQVFRPLGVFGSLIPLEVELFLGEAVEVQDRDPALLATLGRLDELSEVCVTACRQDLLDEASWRGSSHYLKHRRATNVCSTIYSIRRSDVVSGWSGLIAAFRPMGAKPFGAEERELVHGLQLELGEWLWSSFQGGRAVSANAAPKGGADVDAGVSELLSRLSPAQRVVLPYLLEGKTEAEIAAKVFRSRYTVHDHARAIYAACGVRNRVELVLMFTANRRGALPAAQVTSSRQSVYADK